MNKQKQKTTQSVCYAQAVLNYSSGPFSLAPHPGSLAAEKTIRLFIFMLGILVAAQVLNLIQVVYTKAAEPLIFSELNVIRETISQGYVGSYFASDLPVEEQAEEVSEGRSLFAQQGSQVLASQAYRAPKKQSEFQAQLVKQTAEQIRIETGRSMTLEVQYRNTGTATWTNSGDHFIALNVTDPAGRVSAFQHPYWKYYYRPGRLLEDQVKPGEIGTIRFAVKAPETPNEYIENFALVAENLAWISGGKASFKFVVTPPPPAYQAKLAKHSRLAKTVEPGDVFTTWLDFKNTGTATWTNTGDHFIALNVTDPAGRVSAFQHESWSEYYYRPTRLDTETVRPNETGRFEFTLQAPLQPGVYEEHFAVVAENLTWMPGATAVFTFTVAGPAGGENPSEPDIRVGLFSATKKIKLTADAAYDIVDSTGKVLKAMPAGAHTTVSYRDGKYICDAQRQHFVTANYLRFQPHKGEAVFELLNYENRPAWNKALNDNRFRGSLEVRWAKETKKLWVINELPLEQYLWGLAESSGNAPAEYLKALLTAARTYAYYHLQTGTKHAKENFTVDAAFDQVYRGYNFELRAPNLRKYAKETSGWLVLYQDVVVVTPYFSRSDGRTRSWEEVWAGGPYPWLLSVSDPACRGMKLWGHGVGMSAIGALAMAEKGTSWSDILRYYYTGVTLKKIY